jgi:hypothetical protein
MLKIAKRIEQEKRLRLLFVILLITILSLTFYVQSVDALSPDEILSAPAGSPTYYVSPSGSDANPGTETQPFKTIQKAVDIVQAGDTVLVADGVYTDTDKNGIVVWIKTKIGTAEKPITFRSVNKWGARIDGDDFTADFGFYLSGSHYIRIEGFEITAIKDTGINMSGENSHHQIIWNNIHDIARIKIPYTGSVCGGNNGIKTGTLTTDVTIENNIMHTIGRLPTEGDSCNYNHDHGVYVYGQGHLIRNNLFYDLTAGWGLQLSPGNADIKIINNTFAFPNPGRGGHIVLWGGKDNILIEDNIFYQPTNGAIRNNANASCADKTNITIRNNITNLGKMIDGSSCSFDIVGNFLNTDPQFVSINPSNPDFNLSANSPAIDQGISTDAPATDLAGTARPQGTAVDIGAYEYVVDVIAPTFVDVPTDHWAYDYIEILYQGGYIAGCSADPLMYCPENSMTRGESAVFVERGIHGAGYLPVDPTQVVFADVPLSEWFAKWADGLWNDGYTAGCGTDPLVYCPLQEHTRTEGTIFFLRMLNGAGYIPPDPMGIFADVPVDFWGAKWIEAAYNAGLITACETSPQLKFCPDDPLDRAMAAYMMVQAKGLNVP